MDKGIRPYCNAKFAELLPQRAVLGNQAFRKAVREALIEAFGCSEASASTHYNYSFQAVKKSNPELVEGLGRPEDKNNGGRKKKEEPVAVPLLLLTYNPSPAPAIQEQTEFCVKKKSDGSIVAEGLTFEVAREMCVKAKAAKKTALYWV